MNKYKKVAQHLRTHVRDCEPGDRIRVQCWDCNGYGLLSRGPCLLCERGIRKFIASNWLNGGPMAREVVDGEEMELEPIDGDLRMELI